jgi:OpgC protein
VNRSAASARSVSGAPGEARWAFRELAATRDPRLELLRGALLPCLLCPALLALPSLQSLRALRSESLATLVPLSEGLFVLMLAVVAGAVFRSTALAHGLPRCVGALLRRAATWYVAVTGMTLVVALLRHAPWLDTDALTHWTDPATGATGSTYPGAGEPGAHQMFELLFLQAGPPQSQLPALCAALLALAPLAAWALLRRRTAWALLASLLVAALALLASGDATQRQPLLGLQFERSHPLALWQLLFVVGFAAGWHRDAYRRRVAKHAEHRVLLASALFTVAGAAAWHAAALTPGAPFTVALALCVGAPAVLAAHATLSLFWKPLHMALGPLLLPLGRAPLAVWTLHGAWLLVFAQIPPLSTAAALVGLAASWLATWALVRSEDSLRWLPH